MRNPPSSSPGSAPSTGPNQGGGMPGKGGGDRGGSQGGGTRGGDRGGSQSGGSTGGDRGGSQNGGTRGGDRGGSQSGGSRGGDRGGDRGGSQGTSGGSNSGGGYVRPGLNAGGGRPQAGDDTLLTRKSSRSGTVRYQSVNNVYTRGQVDRPNQIGRAPDTRHLTLGDRVNRRENAVLQIGGVRVYYYHYDPRWCDDYFWYPYYTFNPYNSRCVVSPWYYYYSLPGYVSYDRCRFNQFDSWSINWNNWTGTSYRWNQTRYDTFGTGYNNRSSDLDYAIEDIVNAFENGDRRAVSRLVPERSDVAIYVDGQYSYSLNGDDFYDMFLDATQNTRTRRYAITDVKVNGNTARVTARHEFEDPWGRVTAVWHYYELQQERRNVVITKFGTSGGDRW